MDVASVALWSRESSRLKRAAVIPSVTSRAVTQGDKVDEAGFQLPQRYRGVHILPGYAYGFLPRDPSTPLRSAQDDVLLVLQLNQQDIVSVGVLKEQPLRETKLSFGTTVTSEETKRQTQDQLSRT